MSGKQSKEIVWFLWPFAAVWKLLAFVLALTGRVLLAIHRVGIDGCRSRVNHNSGWRAGRRADWSPRSTADDTQHFLVNVQIDLRLDSTGEICKFVLDG